MDSKKSGWVPGIFAFTNLTLIFLILITFSSFFSYYFETFMGVVFIYAVVTGIIGLILKRKTWVKFYYLAAMILNILLIVFMVWYSSVLIVDPFPPTRCQFGAPLVCDGENYKITKNDASMLIVNMLDSVVVTNMEVRYSTDVWMNCTDFPEVEIPIEGTAELKCVFPPDYEINDLGAKQRVTLRGEYYFVDAGPEFTKELYGEIYDNVE